MKKTSLTALLALIAAPACAHAAAVEPARLTLTFEPGAKTGAVMVSLFDTEAAYSGGAPVRVARIDVAKGERAVTFGNLKEGTYAVKAFHDVNGDGKMNLNPFGMPVEPVAFSNDAPVNMGPPAWERARVTVKGAVAQTIQIR